MANKKAMKKSEARIIVYLNASEQPLHFVRKISSKLQMDYGYTIKILMDMYDQGLIRKEKTVANPSRTYYHLTEAGIEKISLANNVAAEQIEVKP